MKKMYMLVTLFCLLATCGTIFAGCNTNSTKERPQKVRPGEQGYEQSSM